MSESQWDLTNRLPEDHPQPSPGRQDPRKAHERRSTARRERVLVPTPDCETSRESTNARKSLANVATVSYHVPLNNAETSASMCSSKPCLYLGTDRLARGHTQNTAKLLISRATRYTFGWTLPSCPAVSEALSRYITTGKMYHAQACEARIR